MANLRASFMFNRDFENAFLHVVKSFIRTNVEDVRAQNVVRFFIYPSVELGEQLRKYGCWCDGARTSPHGYEDCDKIKGLPYPSIIGEDPNDRGKRKVSQLRICPDMDDEVPKHRKDHHHRLGCFIPVESAEKFMVWFQEHGVRDYSGNSELWDERLAARYFVDDYIRRMSIFETGELDRNDKENMVLSLLLSFQGKDIKDDARKSPVAWEAERLLKFLEWNEHDFKLGMKELREAMEEVIKMRLLTNRPRGGRSSREWERPRLSPTVEKYRREEWQWRPPRKEESPWMPPRREYSPWRCISPEEPYIKGESTRRPYRPEERYSYGESTRRRNPPEDQHYRNERQWQNPPKGRQGRSPSRKRYEREHRRPSPSRARSRGEDGRGRYTLPKEQPRGRYEPRPLSPRRGRYEPRSSNPPRRKSQGRATNPPIRYKSRSPSPKKRHGRR